MNSIKDEDKTKGLLIDELAEPRHGIGELEESEAERKRAEEALLGKELSDYYSGGDRMPSSPATKLRRM
jgi:hypothetical protein